MEGVAQVHDPSWALQGYVLGLPCFLREYPGEAIAIELSRCAPLLAGICSSDGSGRTLGHSSHLDVGPNRQHSRTQGQNLQRHVLKVRGGSSAASGQNLQRLSVAMLDVQAEVTMQQRRPEQVGEPPLPQLEEEPDDSPDSPHPHCPAPFDASFHSPWNFSCLMAMLSSCCVVTSRPVG